MQGRKQHRYTPLVSLGGRDLSQPAVGRHATRDAHAAGPEPARGLKRAVEQGIHDGSLEARAHVGQFAFVQAATVLRRVPLHIPGDRRLDATEAEI